MKKFLILLILISAATIAKAQIIVTDQPTDTLPKEIISDKLYKFDLRMPAQCIDKITYQKGGANAEFQLSEDGKTIYITNYKVGNGLRVECTYKDGSRDMFNRTPCSMEIVLPL